MGWRGHMRHASGPEIGPEAWHPAKFWNVCSRILRDKLQAQMKPKYLIIILVAVVGLGVGSIALKYIWRAVCLQRAKNFAIDKLAPDGSAVLSTQVRLGNPIGRCMDFIYRRRSRRLDRRYHRLVMSQLSSKSPLAAGVGGMPSLSSAFAATQERGDFTPMMP